ncbi:MAG: hypothetical protein AABY53_00270, partial [Bdellovibrionota bacterium]
ISNFKFHIDEYKNVIYPFVQKQDNSYFVMNIPISTCDLNNQVTKVNLELPKCEIPKKYASRRSSKKKSRRIASRK